MEGAEGGGLVADEVDGYERADEAGEADGADSCEDHAGGVPVEP